jgi:hypothetical protein
MKLNLRLAASVLVLMILGLAPARAAAPQMSTCYSILTIPCGECPGQRSKYCTPDPSGPFQTCTQSSSDCGAGQQCTQVTTASGPGCDG